MHSTTHSRPHAPPSSHYDQLLARIVADVRTLGVGSLLAKGKSTACFADPLPRGQPPPAPLKQHWRGAASPLEVADERGDIVVLLSVLRSRWMLPGAHGGPPDTSLHPISLSIRLTSRIASWPSAWGVAALAPLASREATLPLYTLLRDAPPALRAFLREQHVVDGRLSACRVSVFPRAEGDLYAHIRGPLFTLGGGGWEALRAHLFHVVWALAVCQHVLPGFRHNDLHGANVLLMKEGAPGGVRRYSMAGYPGEHELVFLVPVLHARGTWGVTEVGCRVCSFS